MHNWFAIALVGVGVGFVAGVFGKGGSALATPLLHAVGVPSIVAVAAPLPATIPATAVGALAYWREGWIDGRIVRWSMLAGVPATVLGALATRWVNGDILVRATDLAIAAIGIRLLAWPSTDRARTDPATLRPVVIVGVALAVGVAAGLLANSGGFLLAPLYLAVLRLPVKSAFGASLAVGALLAVPGTVVHWALGHIDWGIVAVFAVTSVPLSYVGARVALRTTAEHLERVYGAVLATLGLVFAVVR